VEGCLQIWREWGDASSVASALSVLALGEMSAGHYERAKPLLAEALASHVQMGAIGSLGSTLMGLLQVAIHAQSQPKGGMQAASLLGAMYAWGESQDGTIWGESQDSAITAVAQATYEQMATLATDVVGEEAFAREFAAGKQLPLDAAIALAMAIVQPAPDSQQTPTHSHMSAQGSEPPTASG
jgi:hypothetical protein